MNYSTLLDSLAQDCDGVLFDLGSLYSRLTALTDHRHRRGVRYALAVILMAMLIAKLAGQDKPDGIAEWVKLRTEFFVDVFRVKGGTMPHAMTYRRVLADAGLAAELDTLAREFLVSQPAVGRSVQIALDGKTLQQVRRRILSWLRRENLPISRPCRSSISVTPLLLFQAKAA